VSPWLELSRGSAALIVTIPHSGSEIPPELEARMISPWLARKDADWWVDRLYGFATGLGATIIRTRLSRTVIDLNRDPSGASLYPGQATTGLCPTTSFDGEPLYRPGQEPIEAEIIRRRDLYFAPYHAAIAGEIVRLRQSHDRIVVYDAHSIRSRVPRLFDGPLPHLNIGSNRGTTCDDSLTAAIESACRESGFSHVTNGRFVGGWSTRHYGAPNQGVHAVQMELACRGYLDEPDVITPDNWPPSFEPDRAANLSALLADILRACLLFAA
jgi:formiminoglutamase